MRSKRLFGEVILRQSVSSLLLTFGIIVISAAGFVWALTAQYARVEPARGVLVPDGGYSKVFALRPGVIVALLVRDGQVVRAGQRLAIVRLESPNGAGKVASLSQLGSIDVQTKLAERQMALSRQRGDREVSRLSGVMAGLRDQGLTLRSQIGLQEQVVASMSASLEQVKPVVDRGYISRIDYERRRQSLLSAQEDLSRLRQQLIANSAEIERTKNERGEAAISRENDSAGAQSSLETLKQQHSRVEGDESYSIDAPVSGRVTSVQVDAGRLVDASQPLMTIMPTAGKLQATLYVPSRAIGFVRGGQEVRLLYDAYPYQRFGSYVAHVTTISTMALPAQESDAPFKLDEPVYKVTASLDLQGVDAYGRRIPLQGGMTLVGNLVLERQSFLSWLLEPLRAVSKKN